MGFGAWHQRCQSGGEVVRLEQHVGGAIAKRPLQLKHHQPVTINTQAFLCDETSRHLTAQPFEFRSFMHFTADRAVE